MNYRSQNPGTLEVVPAASHCVLLADDGETVALAPHAEFARAETEGAEAALPTLAPETRDSQVAATASSDRAERNNCKLPLLFRVFCTKGEKFRQGCRTEA